MARDDQCIGGDGGQGYPDGCPHPPRFEVGGDLCCSYHLVKVVRQRFSEVKKPTVGVRPIDR